MAELERKVQEIKEEFTKSVYSITGTMLEMTVSLLIQRSKVEANKCG